jgi:hypothetical protein
MPDLFFPGSLFERYPCLRRASGSRWEEAWAGLEWFRGFLGDWLSCFTLRCFQKIGQEKDWRPTADRLTTPGFFKGLKGIAPCLFAGYWKKY